MEPFRIEFLELHQIGPFRNLQITFPEKRDPEKAEIHILTGANGTGKTTLLESLAILFDRDQEINNRLKNKVHQHRSRIGVKTTNSDLCNFEYYNEWIGHPKPTVIYNYTRKGGSNKYDKTGYPFAVFGYSGYRRITDMGVNGVQEIQEHPLTNALSINNTSSSKPFLQWLVNTLTRELIAKGRDNEFKARIYRHNLTLVERVISEVIDSPIQFYLEDSPFKAQIIVENRTQNFDQLPDGLKSMISWIGDLLMRMELLKWSADELVEDQPFILLLDEIEVHLHPAWQRKILPVVQKLFKNAQIFISTHSPFVVGSVDGAWVHRFEKKDGYSVLAGDPILSEDANSYEYILEEIFGIHERFGVQVEKELTEFRAIKQAILTGKTDYNRTRFNELIRSLSSQSTELESIIGMELKQLQRLTQQNFLTTAE